MITDADRRKHESGQSIIEFLLMMPIMVGMMVTLVKANTAAQLSIVNQQYARSHALWLAFNSPIYPERRMVLQDFTNGQNSNQMVILVGEETNDEAKEDSNSGGGAYHPSAPSYNIEKYNTPGKKTSSSGVAKSPSLVRSFASVSLCTQSNAISVGSGIQTADKLGNKNVDFRFCAYPFIDQGSGP